MFSKLFSLLLFTSFTVANVYRFSVTNITTDTSRDTTSYGDDLYLAIGAVSANSTMGSSAWQMGSGHTNGTSLASECWWKDFMVEEGADLNVAFGLMGVGSSDRDALVEEAITSSLTLNILTVATLKANHPRYNDTKFFDHFAQDVPLLYCGGVIMLDIFWYKNSYLSKWDVGETDEQRTFYVLERPAYPPGATCSGSFYILHYSLERVA